MGGPAAPSSTGWRGRPPHPEHHRTPRLGWLRAAVLGANDGIVSTASLIVGVAAADQSRAAVVTAGTAGLVAGAMSMAVGEYVSVSSQRDAELADLARERRELAADPESELHELTRIYERRGLDAPLASEVARQLTEHDAFAAHVRDELGITEALRARPLQAAWSSAAAFMAGALVPLLAALASPSATRIVVVAGAALAALAILGALGARLGGAPALLRRCASPPSASWPWPSRRRSALPSAAPWRVSGQAGGGGQRLRRSPPSAGRAGFAGRPASTLRAGASPAPPSSTERAQPFRSNLNRASGPRARRRRPRRAPHRGLSR